MAKRYHRQKLNQAIAAACLSVTVVPALLATPAMAGITVTATTWQVSGGSTYDFIKLNNSGSVTVENTGSIQGSSRGVIVTGAQIAGNITNNAGGTITGSSAGIYINTNSGLTGSIANSGTISSGQTGIYINTSTVGGDITNDIAAATISGGQTGIYIGNSSTVTGGINNYGTISGGQTGLKIENTSTVTGNIVNNTGGTIQGASSAGIYVLQNTTTGDIDNSGTISGGNYGIYVSNSSTVGSITNNEGGQIAGSNSAGIYVSQSQVSGNIANSGTISSGQTAIYINNSTVNGDITNGIAAAAISGQTGIYIGNSGTVTGGITNNGTISGSQTGLKIENTSTVTGSIVNNAGGTIQGSSSAGIYVLWNTTTGAISNSGDILGGYYGIYAANSSTIASITNNTGGTIQATSSGSAGIYLTESTVTGAISNSGTISGPAGIYAVSSNIGSISNGLGGNITGTNSAGIQLSQTAVSGSITNSGTISGAQIGIFVRNNTTVDGGIVNNAGGTIQGVTTGIRVQSSSTVTGGITNNGTIQGGTYAIYVNNPMAPVAITNTGTLDGAVELADGTLNLNGLTGRVTGAVTGAAGSTVNVNGTFTTENTFSVDGFNIGAAGIFNMAHGVTATSGVTNGGTLSVAAGNTATITGNYTQTANGVFQTGASSLTNYGKLVVTGTADLSASNKVDVKVSAGDTLANGNVLASVLSAGTLTAGGLTVTDNSAMWNFSGTVNGNAIDLTTEQALTFADAVSGDAVSPAAAGVAGALDAIQEAGASVDMQIVLDALGSLGSANEVGQAVSQLMPGFSGGGAQVALGLAGSSGSQVVSERMSGGQGLSSGDPLFKDRMIWAQPFYSWTDQNERKGVVGYTADSHGLALGADGKVDEQWRIGAALSLAKGEVDGDSPVTRNNLEINTYQLTLYATDRLSKATSLNLQAGFGVNDNDSSRHIVFGGLDRVANGDYTSWHTLLDAELEHRYTVSEKTNFASYLRAQYTYVNVEDYTETGAGAINLHMDDTNEDSLVLSVGGRGGYAFTEQMKLTGHLGAGYDLMASQSSVNASFSGGGPTFVTEGLDPASFVLQGGLGFEMLAANGLTVTARYDVDGREDYTNQVASLKFQMPF
ncbi:MAG: autotransporter domain-containing protein [Desulfurivibrionaceae bacterium]